MRLIQILDKNELLLYGRDSPPTGKSSAICHRAAAFSQSRRFQFSDNFHLF